MSADPVARFTAAITEGTIPAGLFADDAVVDATVPNWRWTVRGAERVTAHFAGWYAQPARFEELVRVDVPGGALVEFLLAWEEDGVPYAAHQTHRITTRGGRIAADTVFCGGRWPAELLAEMEAAAHHAVH